MSSLEQAITDMRAAQEETNNRFLQLIANMSQQVLQPETPASEISPPKLRSVRPASPPEFDGERTKGMAFLNSCQTYLRLCPKEFADEQTKIVWAMSYMKSGRAQKWTARIFRWEQQPENVGENKFLDWEDFCTEFKQEFTPAHADTLAINRLESAAYYQKGRPLDDYIDEFQDLITDSGYTDNKVIVVKFRRGLSTLIQNAVATMASGRPSDDRPEQWYKVARTVDQNRSANEAFSSSRLRLSSLRHFRVQAASVVCQTRLLPRRSVSRKPRPNGLGRRAKVILRARVLPLQTPRTFQPRLSHPV
jgi:Retrotransposon gag protein